MKLVTWNEYSEILKKVYEEIRLKQFDTIVAIGRGGSIIGAYLASKLDIPTFYPIFLRHVGKKGVKRIEDVSPYMRDQIKSLRGRTLIVDDYLRDGLAMKYVLKLISKEASVNTLVIYNHRGSEFKPDIVGKYIGNSEISFPYDIF
ncbi:phosphoribosyltransferase [Thermoproteota archaeon]